MSDMRTSEANREISIGTPSNGTSAANRDTAGEDVEILHSHLHEHADGVVHNHFHSHVGGGEPHVHEDGGGGEHVHATAHEHVDAHVHAREAGDDSVLDALPRHVHEHNLEHRLILEADDVAYTFPRAKAPVFENISFNAYAGTMTAILGNNGAGKTTLLNLLGNINRPTAGTVTVSGNRLDQLNRRQIAQHIAYVSQQQRIPHLSVYDEVLLGRKPHVSWTITENDRAVTAAAIDRLCLSTFASRYCDELSGGERQKVYIARALAQETEVLLLDEPTSALDPKNQMEVLQAVRDITTQSMLATIMVIHDINLALRFCDRFLLIRDGRVISQGGKEAVTEKTLSEAYDMPIRLVEIDGVRLAIT